MRSLAALVALVVVCTVAGCIDPLASPAPEPSSGSATPTAEPSPGDAPTPSPSAPASGNGTSNGTGNETGNGTSNATAPDYSDRTFCDSESACDFWDEQYHEYVLYSVDTYDIDVLIVPSASINALGDTQTMKKAIQAWGDGIRELGAPWLAGNLSLNIYVIGQDIPPPEALTDPEIIVVAAAYNPVLLFGIGEQLPSTPCIGGKARTEEPAHSHDGMTILAADCEQGGKTCLAINTNFLLGSYHQLYDLVSHEFGHCLGLGHVGDAGVGPVSDFSAKIVPIEDIMSYQEDPEQVHCVSTLNVRVLEGIYGRLLGQNPALSLSAGQYYAMDPRDYAWTDCANPI